MIINPSPKNSEALRSIVRASRSAPLYKRKYRQIHLRPGFMTSTFPLLPFLKREECKRIEDLQTVQHPHFVFQSRAGAIYDRSVFPVSKPDYEALINLERHKFEQFGVSRTDICSVVAFSDDHTIAMSQAILQMGATYVPIDGPEERMFSDICQSKVNVVVTLSRVVLNMLDFIEHRKLTHAIRLIIVAGERVYDYEDFKKRVQKIGAEAGEYIGSTELGTYGIRCKDFDRFHFVNGYFLYETLDDAVMGSEETELIVTPLWRKEYPLIRYRIGDSIRIMPYARCSCTGTGRYAFEYLGRIDNRCRINRNLYAPVELVRFVRERIFRQYFFDGLIRKMIREPRVLLILTRTKEREDQMLVFLPVSYRYLTLRRRGKLGFQISTKLETSTYIHFTDSQDFQPLSGRFIDIRNTPVGNIDQRVNKLLVHFGYRTGS